MPPEGSVTCLLAPAQAGDPAAVQQLWERYFRRLVGLARQKLRGAAPAGGDAEDVALSTFTSFWRNAERGRFPLLADRDGLWRLLMVITARKAAHLLRDEQHEPNEGLRMARQVPRLVLCSCAALCWLTAAAAADDSAPPEPKKVQVAVDGKSVMVNGKALPLPPRRADLIKLLGKPTRVTTLRYTCLTWDEYGLCANENPATGKIEAVTVAFGKRDYEYWPKKTFSGAARVDGALVTAQSSVAEINRQKKGEHFERNFLVTDSWDVYHDGLLLSLVEAGEEGKNFSFLQIGIIKRR
jgi:DNA-directed RNA polymerase specialized sigma24 family protein